MPIVQTCIHRLDKTSAEQTATLTHGEAAAGTPETETLLASFNTSFHAKPKAWGHFFEGDQAEDGRAEEGDDPAGDATRETGSNSRFASALWRYRQGELDFTSLSRESAESLRSLVDAHLSVGGHWWVTHHRQGDSEFLTLALLHQRDGYGVDTDLNVAPVRQLNLGQLMLAARIDLSQWQGGSSRQYIAYVRDRGSKKLSESFRDWLGCQEGVDASRETRTLLKAFSDYVEQEDFPEQASREKTETLIDYANAQAKRGEPITLDELSELVDETKPKAFYDYIRNQDYGLAAEIPPDKRTLQQFRRFTGRTSGVSISFDSHLLGNSIEYDEERDRLIIKQIPTQLKEQIKQRDG